MRILVGLTKLRDNFGECGAYVVKLLGPDGKRGADDESTWNSEGQQELIVRQLQQSQIVSCRRNVYPSPSDVSIEIEVTTLNTSNILHN